MKIHTEGFICSCLDVDSYDGVYQSKDAAVEMSKHLEDKYAGTKWVVYPVFGFVANDEKFHRNMRESLMAFGNK